MRWFRVLALSGLLALVCLLAACGGGGSSTPPPGPLVITTDNPLPQALINLPYLFHFNASGGTTPYTWSISSGALPAGITLTAATGNLTGTPTVSGVFNFNIQVMDSANHVTSSGFGLSVEGVVTITCNACAPGTMSLPSGSVGVPYPPAGTTSPQFAASGGVGPYTWCVVETGGACDMGQQGALPAGLSIDPQTGNISGTPISQPAAPLTVNVQARDSESPAASSTVQVTLAIFSIITTQLPNGFINQPYRNGGQTVLIVASGGIGSAQHPYTWSITAGSLPPGLSLCVSTSTPSCGVTGTPTQMGTFPFTVQVTDGENPPATATANLSIIVQGAMLTLNTTVLPQGSVGAPYPVTLHTTGGIPPLTWCIKESSGTCDDGSNGALPPGLTMNANSGAISGTPSTAGQYGFIAQVQDTENPPQVVDSGTLNIVVNRAIDNSLLHGNYVFAINGFSNGAPYVMAGAFIADGSGNITSGKLDVNYGQGEPNNPHGCLTNPNCPQAEVMQPGSVYDLSSGNGLGTINVATVDFLGAPHTYTFSISVAANACVAGPSLSSCGRIIQRDPTNPQTFGSGVLKVQDSDFFSVDGMNGKMAFFPGNFAFSASGINPGGNRYAFVGALGTNPVTRVDIDCNGNNWHLPGCPLDINSNGVIGSSAILGQFASQVDPTFGRGDFVNLSFQNPPDGFCVRMQQFNACGYAYYIVNKQEMILISTDPLSRPANMTLWSAYRQRSFARGWTNAQLMGPMIMELTGVDNGSSDVIAGIFNADGNGNATFASDENDSGTLTTQPPAQGTYAVDPTNGANTGRFTLGTFPQLPNGAVAYFYTGDFGYVLSSDGKVKTGVAEQQTGAPFSSASVIGTLEGGTAWPATVGVTNTVDWVFADGGGDITAQQFTSGAGGPGGPNDLTLTYQVDSTGRSVLMQNGSEIGVLYVIGTNKFVVLPTGTNPVLAIFISGQPD